jgi:hypothetical protein
MQAGVVDAIDGRNDNRQIGAELAFHLRLMFVKVATSTVGRKSS